MKKAFTLVEMLVAVVLITLLIGVALFAFRLQIITIAKTKKSAIDTVITYEQVHSSLASIKYYVVDRYDLLEQPMRQLHFFFKGTSSQINYITTNPILSEETALARLVCRNGELLYYEEPLYQRIDYLRPAIPKENRPRSLYRHLERCRFSYTTRKGQIVSTLKDDLPVSITTHLHRDHQDISIVAHIQSDDNTSLSRIRSVLFE